MKMGGIFRAGCSNIAFATATLSGAKDSTLLLKEIQGYSAQHYNFTFFRNLS
jgi:hypothetical protein